MRGRVVDAVTGTAVRRVRVNVFASSPNGGGSGFAVTDAEGNFEIRELPAGRYTINAMKSGYLNWQFGQKVHNQPGTPLDVLDGQLVEKIVIAMPRGGVVSGRVMDEFGEAVSEVEVRALRYRYVDGRRQLAPGGMGRTIMTDDLGGFRLWALEPGEYYISATPRRDMFMGPPNQQPADNQGPTQTYFPGTPSPIDAKRITVQAGRETAGIVFSLVSARLARIRGRAILSSGEPFTGSFIQLTQRSDSGGMTTNSGGTVRGDGTFELPNVAPGNYLLQIRSANNVGPMEMQNQNEEIGREFVSVNGEDINDLLIVGMRGAVARGRFITDEGVPLPTLKNAGISVEPVDRDRPYTFRGGPNRVKEDGSFELTGLFDRQRLQPNVTMIGPPPPGAPGERPWQLKAVMYDGQDVTDRGIDFQPGQVIEGIEAIFTRTVSTLRGRFLDDRGAPAQGWVIMFPADETLWLPRSRFIRPSRPGSDGEYRMGNVPAYDDYLIVGVADIENGQWLDPETLQTLKQHASSLSIREGETKVQDVKLVRWPQ
jgi:hypothetical protein